MSAGLIYYGRATPDAVAVRTDERTVTYGELNEEARRLSHALAKAGATRGGAVAVVLPNGVEFFAALHAAGRLGAIVVPVNTHFKHEEAGWVIRDSGAQVIVVDASMTDALSDVTDIPWIVLGGEGDNSYQAALAAAPDTGEVDDKEVLGDGWPTTMAYTSGTTGRPKGIAMGKDDFRRSAEGYAMMGERWALTSADTHLLVGPMYHSGPLAWGQMHLAFGASVTVMRKWDSVHCLELIQRDRPSNVHMVPANFSRLLKLSDGERAQYDISSVKMFVHAAAPCPIPLKRAFMAYVGEDKVWEYFGASEGGGSVISPEEWLARPGSVGRPHGADIFAIFDDDGNEVPRGTVGTIYVKPAASSFEYRNDPEKTAAAHRGGYFTVGDAGYMDDEGYLFLADRKSDMVISGGVNIYPREIEDVLHRHDDVIDVTVFGVPDERWGEILLAMVQKREGSDLSEDDVIEFVREHLADFKRPRIVEFVSELPRDPNGKVRKPKMREAWIAAHSQ
jgi:long-chain acyl-CoA synthetase